MVNRVKQSHQWCWWLRAPVLVLAMLLGTCNAIPRALAPATPPPGQPATVDVCGIPNFAWTIDGTLARSAQPPDAAWQCLHERGFTTIIRQNPEDNPEREQRAVQQIGMEYIGDYAIPDQTTYSPEMLETMLHDVVERLRQGQRILVHDAGGRGRMGFWEAAFLMWDGWSSQDAIDRYIAFGWKIDCNKGGNGQMQAINEIATALGQPTYYPARDSYGTPWKQCRRPAYMRSWNYAGIDWPAGGNAGWNVAGSISGGTDKR